MIAAWLALFFLMAGPHASVAAVGPLPAIPATAIRGHMSFLADDLLEGRETGSRGYELAARYVAAQFESIGLEPAGSDQFFQPVPLREARVVRASASISRRDRAAEELTIEQDYVVQPNFFDSGVELNAEVVFAGFGITATERQHDDYSSIDARGKVVAFIGGAPPSFPPTERAHYASSHNKAENAVRHGAIGVITLRSNRDEQRTPWSRVVTGARRSSMRWVAPDGSVSLAFPQLRASMTLSRGGAMKLFGNGPGSLDQILKTAETAAPRAFALPARMMVSLASDHESTSSPNVAAILRGSDPRLANEYLVYSAHLDHIGLTPRSNEKDGINNGALDNASGIASLIEIARAFRSLPERPRRSILFLAVTGEEKGLQGSDFFVAFPTVPREQVVADINMDMFLMLFPMREIIAIGIEHSTLAHPFRIAAERLGVRIIPDPDPDEVVFVRSDQYSFVRHGIPAIMVSQGRDRGSGTGSAGSLVREWMRTTYHSPQDDLEQDLDYEAGATYALLNFIAGLEIANAAEPPRWNVNDFFGTRFGGRVRGALESPPDTSRNRGH